MAINKGKVHALDMEWYLQVYKEELQLRALDNEKNDWIIIAIDKHGASLRGGIIGESIKFPVDENGYIKLANAPLNTSSSSADLDKAQARISELMKTVEKQNYRYADLQSINEELGNLHHDEIVRLGQEIQRLENQLEYATDLITRKL